MISRLFIENFRTHIKSEFNFTSGINSFIGNPDSGKTNIIRAILWALTNRPLGFRFHSDVSPDSNTIVRIEFQEGSWIQLEKTKKFTKYSTWLDDKLEAIGSEVPDVISSIANMSELNIQRQLDQPFLICSSPSEVAKIFNRTTKLERIDKSVSLLTTDINSANKTIKILAEQADKLTDQTTDLKVVEEMQVDNEEIQSLNQDWEMIEDNNEELAEIICDIKKYEKDIEKYKSLKSAINDLGEIKDCCDRFDSLQKKIQGLTDLIESVNCHNKKIKNSFKGVNEALGDYEILQNLSGNYEQRIAKVGKLDDYIIALKLAENQIEINKDLLKSKADAYRIFLKKIKICPFCDKCETPLEEHDFNLFLKEFDV